MGYNGLSIQLDHAHLQQELPVVLLQSPDYDLLSQHALWYPAQTSMEYNQLKVLIISPGFHQAFKSFFHFRASRTLWVKQLLGRGRRSPFLGTSFCLGPTKPLTTPHLTHWTSLNAYSSVMRCCKPSGFSRRFTLSQVKGTSSNFLHTQECLFSAWLFNQDGVQPAALRSLAREFPHRDCSGHVYSRTSLEIMLGSSHTWYHWHPFSSLP